MSLVNKFFGRGHEKAESKNPGEADRLAADQARQFSVPTAQSLSDQAAIRVRMEEELAQARARREAGQTASGD